MELAGSELLESQRARDGRRLRAGLASFERGWPAAAEAGQLPEKEFRDLRMQIRPKEILEYLPKGKGRVDPPS